MREADGVVGKLQVSEYVHFATAPGATVAVLVGGEILEDRFQRLAVRVSGICKAGMRAAGNAESVIRVEVPVEHEPIIGRVGYVAIEFAEWRATRPGCLADIRVLKCAVGVFRQ